MKYYIYNTQGSNGIRVIVDNLVKAFMKKGIELIEVKTLDQCRKEDVVIPMCLKECLEVHKKGFRSEFGLLMDAISLGYKNKILFYLKRGHIFNYDFLYSIYGYLRYVFQEGKVVKVYNNLMLVSNTDINYLKDKFSNAKCKFVHIENGANFEIGYKHIPGKILKLGILSPWGAVQVYEENNWFVRSYFKKLVKDIPNIELILAGRGRFIEKFRGIPNVKVVGEVKSLNDFFSEIDVFVTTNPKGCGVLNRVIDAFVHKVPVLGVPSSFSGFNTDENIFFSFDNYKSLRSQIIKIMNNPGSTDIVVENAYEYVKQHNNWELNYDKLSEYILKSYPNV